MVRLETERLVIRDPLPQDLHSWHSLMSDADTMYYLQDIMHHSLEDTRKNLDTALCEAAQGQDRTMYFLTAEKKSGEYVGQVGYTVEEFTPLGKIAHVGYFLRREFHNQGYATEAFRRLIEFAFTQDNVIRLKTGCLADNAASERVMQKCGMIKEGHYKNCQYHDGQLRDRVIYRLLKDEWTAQQ